MDQIEKWTEKLAELAVFGANVQPDRLVGVGALVVVASGCGGGGEVPPLPEGRSLAVTQSLTPDVQLFAEPVVARVDVLVDGERFDPDRGVPFPAYATWWVR